MNYLSESTRKERRSLLLAGFIGVVVGQLKIYPTEIDLWGLKFHSPHLTLIVVGSLCAIVGYFLIKFFFSYLFEKSSSTSALLAAQITEGKISLDIALAEDELGQMGRSLLIRQNDLRTQQENAATRIKYLQEQTTKENVHQTAKLKEIDEQIRLTRKILDENPGDPIQLSSSASMSRKNIENNILTLEDERKNHLLDMEKRRLKEAQDTENEIHNAKALSEQLAKDMKKEESSFQEKREKILKFQKLHRVVGRITPINLALEIWLPILLGLYSILSLGYLMFHLPPPPKPLVLPEL